MRLICNACRHNHQQRTMVLTEIGGIRHWLCKGCVTKVEVKSILKPERRSDYLPDFIDDSFEGLFKRRSDKV